jgi:8-oxo-dGTP pyrophosphatase MutT (NUDIX family)
MLFHKLYQLLTESDEIEIIPPYKDPKKPKFWGARGAGVLVYCRKTDRYLLGLRSDEVNEPRTWGIFGGKIDRPTESSKTAALRELREETRYRGPISLNMLHRFDKDGFVFYNYIGYVSNEFKPRLDWENDDARWFKKDEFPTNLHFGLRHLLDFLP